jgi:hypothetical protein
MAAFVKPPRKPTMPILLKKSGANFYGFESIDAQGKVHWHPLVIRGSGELSLDEKRVFFKQRITATTYEVALSAITRVEVALWHNGKMKWPARVLRIFYTEGKETRIIGFATGGRLSLTKGFVDDVWEWKNVIDEVRGKQKTGVRSQESE